MAELSGKQLHELVWEAMENMRHRLTALGAGPHDAVAILLIAAANTHAMLSVVEGGIDRREGLEAFGGHVRDCYIKAWTDAEAFVAETIADDADAKAVH